MSSVTEIAERKAVCLCGQLSITATGAPLDVYACSCRDCQKVSGSAFTYMAVYSDSAVSISGEKTVWRYYGDSGRWNDNAFCPVCGTTLYAWGETGAGYLGISVGCFSDRDFQPPAALYWATRRHHWLSLPPATKLFDTQPG